MPSFFKKKRLAGFFVCLFVLVVSDSEFAEEGVWPLSQGRVSIGCSKAQGWGFMTISGYPPKCSSFFQNENKQWSFRSEIASIYNVNIFVLTPTQSQKMLFSISSGGGAHRVPRAGGGAGSRLEHHPHGPREGRVRRGQ